MPWYAAVFMLFTMGNVGLPGTSGFVGEILTLTGAYGASHLAGDHRRHRRDPLGGLRADALPPGHVRRDHQSGAGAITDLDRREVLIFAPLIVGTLVLGLQPGLVFNITNAASDHLVGAYHAATGR